MNTKKTAAVTAAKTNELHYKTYRKTLPLSNLKEQIGQLLLNLQIQREPQVQWELFESELRRYLDLKLCGELL